MSTHRILLAVVLAFGFIWLSGCKSDGEKDKSTYKFGVAAPFTGQEGAPLYGENIKRGVELAVEEINAAGGVRGRKLKPCYEDTRLLPPVAVSAVQKLISLEHVSVVIGPVASSSTIAASKVAEREKVVLISPASTSNEISGMSPYVFRTIAPDTFEGRAMADFAWDRGYRRFGVVFVDNAGTRGPAEVFRKEVEKKGGVIQAFEVVPQGSTDARTQVTKVIGAKVDAVYLLGYALELGNMVRQVREQSKELPILSFQVMEEPKVREIAGDAAEGVVFTTPTLYGTFATGKPAEFIQKYRAKYKMDPGIFSANAYDAVRVLAAVIDKHGFEVADIRDGLSKIRGFDGASGKFDIDDKGDSNQQPRFMVIRSGQLQLLESNSGKSK